MRKNLRKLVGTTLMMTAAMAFCFTGVDANAATESRLSGDFNNDNAYTSSDLVNMNSEIRQYRTARNNGTTYFNRKADMDGNDILDYQDYAILKRLVNEAGNKELGDMNGDHIYDYTDAYSLNNEIRGYVYGQQCGSPYYNAKADLDCDGDIDEDDMALLEQKIYEVGDLNNDGKQNDIDVHWMSDEMHVYSEMTSEHNFFYEYRADLNFDGKIDSADMALLRQKTGC